VSLNRLVLPTCAIRSSYHLQSISLFEVSLYWMLLTS
jgi:hypothetical protein